MINHTFSHTYIYMCMCLTYFDRDQRVHSIYHCLDKLLNHYRNQTKTQNQLHTDMRLCSLSGGTVNDAPTTVMFVEHATSAK